MNIGITFQASQIMLSVELIANNVNVNFRYRSIYVLTSQKKQPGPAVYAPFGRHCAIPVCGPAEGQAQAALNELS